MRTKGITLQEAATVLGVTDRTVRNYLKQGFLLSTKKRGDRRTWLDPLEVEDFRRDKEESKSRTIFSKQDLVKLQGEMRRLRSELDVVLRILDTKSDPLRMTEEYAGNLFEVCVAQLRLHSWDLADIQPWTEVFFRLDEEDLQTLSLATSEKRPWKPFLQLCVAMTVFVSAQSDYETSLELQAMHRQLAEGRRRLRVASLIYSEMYTGMDADLARYGFAEAPASVQDSLRSILTGKNRR